MGYLEGMFRNVNDFFNAWDYESKATLKVFRELTDASLAQKVSPEGRSLGFLAWHITTTLSEMMSAAGLAVHATTENQPVPSTAAAIADTYEKGAKAVADAVRASWTDAQLTDTIPMYGEMWTKAGVLGALIGHQCHHRGQMTVLMRQAGLRVPGVYGPSKEEWAPMGVAPQP
jgi:uncharacterized damage-inducible protein DinB